MARLGQQEQADLRDVRPGGDVHQVILGFRIERIRSREVVQVCIHRLEIPWVGRGVDMQAHLRLRRHVPDVVAHGGGEARMRLGEQELEARHDEVLVLAQRHARAPLLPSPGTSGAAIQHAAEEAKDDDPLPLSHIDKS